MLISLKITNIALIEDIEIHFKKGLNILSGETGAGKSIILNSIALVLGEVGKSELIRTGKNEAKILAIFDLETKPDIKNFLQEEMGILATENLLFIERHIYQDKRPSNAFINHQKVLIQALKKIGNLLINIHSQHENQKLFDVKQHIHILDSYCQNQALLETYTHEFQKAIYLKKLIQELETTQTQYEEQTHLYELTYQELDQAQLEENEILSLEQQLIELEQQEQLLELFTEYHHHFYSKEHSVISSLQLFRQDINKIPPKILEQNNPYESLDQIFILLEPIMEFIQNQKNLYEGVSEKLSETQKRYSFLKELERKYKKTINELISYKQEIKHNLHNTEDPSKLINLKKDREEVIDKLTNIALKIRENRIQGSQELETKIQEQLVFLNLEHTQIKIQLEVYEDEKGSVTLDNNKKVQLRKEGIEKAQFLISFNKGEDLKPLNKVGSGGEVSRVILAIKSVLQNIDRHATQIFDEVDTGIGGETAFLVGKKLKKMAEKQQIICITHLPQIAATGALHYKVYKIITDNRTETIITPLTHEERITEISRMLSGDNITNVSTQHAIELMNTV